MVDIDIVRLPFIQDALETLLCSYRYSHRTNNQDLDHVARRECGDEVVGSQL